MTDKRFPVANTSSPLTVPWEVADTACQNRAHAMYQEDGVLGLDARGMLKWEGGLTEQQLDTWYGRHWREMAQ